MDLARPRLHTFLFFKGQVFPGQPLPGQSLLCSQQLVWGVAGRLFTAGDSAHETIPRLSLCPRGASEPALDSELGLCRRKCTEGLPCARCHARCQGVWGAQGLWEGTFKEIVHCRWAGAGTETSVSWESATKGQRVRCAWGLGAVGVIRARGGGPPGREAGAWALSGVVAGERGAAAQGVAAWCREAATSSTWLEEGFAGRSGPG